MFPSRKAEFSTLLFSTQQVSRSLLAHQLRAIGANPISLVSRLVDAKRSLEFKKFDLVLLDDDDPNAGNEGRTMVEDLRRCGHLDIKTIVLLTSSIATHTRVTDAAESGVDCFLLRPFSQSALHERIDTALVRRQTLSDIYLALGSGDWDAALVHCQARIRKRLPLWLYAARIAAEILLMQGKLDDAQIMYRIVLENNALPWAKLGLGRVLFAQRKHSEAADYLAELAQTHPEQTDTYDLMAEAHLELGQFDAALNVYEIAAKATPGSVSRLQRLGFAAHFCHHDQLAAETLERSLRIGHKSKSFDSQSLVFLGQMHAEQGRLQELKDLIKRADGLLEFSAEPERLQEHIRVLSAYQAVCANQLNQARSIVLPLCERLYGAQSCIDLAFNTASVLALLAQRGQTQSQDAELIDYAGTRFAHSKLSAQWLARGAKQHEPYCQSLAQAYERAFQMAQTAFKPHLDGKTNTAICDVVHLACKTLNLRVIDMASKMVERYADQLADPKHLQRRLAEVKASLNLQEKQRNPISRHLKHPGGLSLLARSVADVQEPTGGSGETSLEEFFSP